MQSVPPLNRKINNRNVNHTDNSDDRTSFIRPSPIRDGVLKRQVTKVKEEENQVGRPQRDPVQRAKKAIKAPVGANEAAIIGQSFFSVTKPRMQKMAINT